MNNTPQETIAKPTLTGNGIIHIKKEITIAAGERVSVATKKPLLRFG
jgi:hypothetical protein